MKRASATAIFLAALAVPFASPQGLHPDVSPASDPAAYGPNADAMSQMMRIRVYGTDRDAMRSMIDAGMEILAARPGEWTDLWIPAGRVPEIETLGYPFEILAGPPRDVPDYYTRYGEMLSLLESYAADYSSIARLEDVGDGWGKIYNDPDYPSYEVWALKISDNPGTDEAEPVILYTGVHHAREPATLEITLGIIDHLLTNYGLDPDITRWINEHETWVIPLVNPDGHWCCTDLDWMMWRKNVRDNDGNGEPTQPYAGWYPDGVDPNRNYSWHWGGEGASHSQSSQVYCGPSAFSEPETQATRDFHYRELPVFTLDYHSYSELVLWPYGYDSHSNAPDEPTLEAIGIEIASRIQRWGGGGHYQPMQANQLYPAAGNSADWEYGELNTFSYIIETCTEFYPGEGELNHAIEYNIQGAMYLQERVDGPGVRGIIRVDGIGAQGTISVVGIDDPPMNLPRRSHEDLGDYYRILSPGTYDIVYEVSGWNPIIVEDVVVPPDDFVVVDVDFGISSAPDGEPGTLAAFGVSPNPVLPGNPVTFRLPPGHEVFSLKIHDAQGRLVTDLSRQAHGAKASYAWRPEREPGAGLYGGIYYARLMTETSVAVRRFVVLGH